MRYRLKIVLIIFLIFINTINAQTPELQIRTQQTSFFKGVWNDLKKGADNTFSIDKHNLFSIAAFSGITSLFILSTDLEMHEEYGIEKETSPIGIPQLMGKVGRYYDKPGPVYFAVGFAGTMYGAGKMLHNQKLVETTNLVARSLIVTGVITTALKMLIGRARPYQSKDPHRFKPFNFKLNSDYMSMPSGHTSSIFAMMTVIAKLYDSWYVKIPAYSFAASVAFQRMDDKKHWSSDLLVGATIGYLIGSTIVKKHRSDNIYEIQPVFSLNSVGFAIQF